MAGFLLLLQHSGLHTIAPWPQFAVCIQFTQQLENKNIKPMS
ncbi:hypothetical protein DLM_0214 [Aquitalea magnusonii]|uniref:Uncharacterized protein n=1 Tax=Aquitalea magnusonii TaxID=332411 RepID=A0A3G9GE84_9NEIS|nr:hypothetical protein DLM_0214 [Aquitalea magnusonii]